MDSLLGRFQLDSARGALLLDGQARYLLIRPETLAGFQRALEAEIGVDATGAVLAGGGRQGGSASTRRFLDAGATPEAAAQSMAAMAPGIGWGSFEVVTFDAAAKRLEMRVTGSPFAEAYGASEHPVCHFIRGVVLGIAEGAFGSAHERLRCVESQCVSTGAESCTFLAERYNEG